MPTVTRDEAFALLGAKDGPPATVQEAAVLIGVSVQSVYDWPDTLPARIADRVQAAVARRLLPAALIGHNEPARSRQAGAREEAPAKG